MKSKTSERQIKEVKSVEILLVCVKISEHMIWIKHWDKYYKSNENGNKAVIKLVNLQHGPLTISI